jgi:hypothetical protein
VTIAEKLALIAQNEQKVYDAGYAAGQETGSGYEGGYAAGRQAEYDSFWDVTQRNGDRKDWEYAFSGIGWTDDNYNPKYTIRGAITNAFRRSGFTNTLVPVVVVGGTANAFNASLVATIPSIDLTEATNTATCFNNANRLVNVTFEGTIPTTVNMQFASGLSVASMKSAIHHLANYAGTANANVNSLYFSDDCWAALEADSAAPHGGTWRDYVMQLGWNA